MDTLIRLAQAEANAVNSQFRITPCMALNQVDRLKTLDRINDLLDNSFNAFQQKAAKLKKAEGASSKNRRKKQAGEAERMVHAPGFADMLKFLKASFVRENNQLTDLGRLASVIPMESSLMVADS